MLEFVDSLNKRRRITIYIVILLAIIALIVSYSFKISSPTYFDGKYNMYFVYGLIIYKLIELPILYYILFHRYISHMKKEINFLEKFPKFKKHVKLLFFLIPQGNTIFGIIAYKLSGDIFFFLLFSLIALSSLFLIRPKNFIIN